MGVTQAAPVQGEGELRSQGLKCSGFSSYHSKEMGKKTMIHFPYRLPYIKRVICLNSYRVDEVCKGLSAS